MRMRSLKPIFAAGLLCGAASTVSATAPDAPAESSASAPLNGPSDDRFAAFTPTTDPIRHRIDYGALDYALKQLVVSMGPSNRARPRTPTQPLGTRRRQGHNSNYRLEGSMVGFAFFDDATRQNFSEYRRELEGLGDALDISSLPRNEQLAFWFNLHNVTMIDIIGQEWPVRQPREIEIDGVPMDEAQILTVSGVSMSLRDIREEIVFANWRNPKVIYGFWRGEIGGPALEREAYTGGNVGSLLDIAAEDFVNSLRGTQRRGDILEVSTLYADTARFYFPDFEKDVRAHLAEYANEEVAEILADTSQTDASIREWDIADLAGGARGANYLQSSRPGVPPGVLILLGQRQRKLEELEREQDGRRGRVIFSNITLPGDPPNKNAVE